MKKNYYQILQISENASQDVIEKVFKVLAKKYHPDLQAEENKAESAERFKEINEAYQTLSDSVKRAEYDKALIRERQAEEYEKSKLREQNEQLKRMVKNGPSNQNTYSQPNHVSQVNHNTNNINQNYYETNDQDETIENLKAKHNLDPNVKVFYDPVKDQYFYYREKTFKEKAKSFVFDKLKAVFAVAVVIGIILLIIQIPFVKEYGQNLYQSNTGIKIIVDGIISIFKK